MNSIYRSILARSLMTGVALLAVMTMGPAGVRAETVIVQGDDGPAGPDGVNPGDDGMPGGDGEPVAAKAGSAHPITAPLNTAAATAEMAARAAMGPAAATAATAALRVRLRRRCQRSSGGNGASLPVATAGWPRSGRRLPLAEATAATAERQLRRAPDEE